MTGTRLLTAEADKTIKIWKEDEDAVSAVWFYVSVANFGSLLYIGFHMFVRAIRS